MQQLAVLQKSRSHLKTVGVRSVTNSKIHTEDPKLLGTTTKFCCLGEWAPGIVASLFIFRKKRKG
jgi:hypothetical protein